MTARPLTDYDIIGAAAAGSGLFALARRRRFNLLCIPPLARERDVGLSTCWWRRALCRERQAMLIVDPPASLEHRRARRWMRCGTGRSAAIDAVMYFPRVQAFDRLRGRVEVFALLRGGRRHDRALGRDLAGVGAAESEEAILRPGLRPAVPVNEAERARLAQAGINTLQSGAQRRRAPAGAAHAAQAARPRRLALPVGAPPRAVRRASIEQGTRWVLFERNGPAIWERAQARSRRFSMGSPSRAPSRGQRRREPLRHRG